MSVLARAPPPPKRAVPPPPPRPAFEESGSGRVFPSFTQGSIYAPPPVLSRGGTRQSVTPVLSRSNTHGLGLDDNDFLRLLARRPPPPPSRATGSNVPVIQPKTPLLPPRESTAISRAPILPPPVHFSSKPALITEDNLPTPPIQDSSCLQCRDFSQVDAHAAMFPRTSFHSLQDLATALTEPFQEDVDKARVIFTWLHYNISYDAHAFLSGNVQHTTPEETLATGLAVCEGYAGLFERLGDLVGLQVHKVSGHGKGYGYQALQDGAPTPEISSNHAWNCILLDDEWQLVDSCWGSGVLSGASYEPKFSPHWFTSTPIEFGQKHFPTDPSFQLTTEEVTWEEYILAPDGSTLTGDFHEYGLHPLLVQPPTKGVPERQFIRFCVGKRCQHMSTAEIDNYVLVISTNGKDFTPLTFDEDEGVWAINFFTPRDGNVTLYTVNTVNNQDAKGLGLAGFNKAKGRKAMGFKGLAVWSVVHL